VPAITLRAAMKITAAGYPLAEQVERRHRRFAR
jgi:hypothetical protein